MTWHESIDIGGFGTTTKHNITITINEASFMPSSAIWHSQRCIPYIDDISIAQFWVDSSPLKLSCFTMVPSQTSARNGRKPHSHEPGPRFSLPAQLSVAWANPSWHPWDTERMPQKSRKQTCNELGPHERSWLKNEIENDQGSVAWWFAQKRK